MKRFLIIGIFIYATLILLVNLNIIQLEKLFIPKSKTDKRTMAVSLLQNKYNAETIFQDQNFTESKIMKLFNKIAIFDTNVIKLYSKNNSLYVILSSSIMGKRITFLLEYNSTMSWKYYRHPKGNIIAAIKINKYFLGDELKLLTGIDGIEIPLQSDNILLCEGELIDFVNI